VRERERERETRKKKSLSLKMGHHDFQVQASSLSESFSFGLYQLDHEIKVLLVRESISSGTNNDIVSSTLNSRTMI
jgi:hypothetical protein